jgi:hypothetical protein
VGGYGDAVRLGVFLRDRRHELRRSQDVLAKFGGPVAKIVSAAEKGTWNP